MITLQWSDWSMKRSAITSCWKDRRYWSFALKLCAKVNSLWCVIVVFVCMWNYCKGSSVCPQKAVSRICNARPICHQLIQGGV